MCGEKTKPVPAGGILMGSPPRVRGKGPAGQILVVSVGITPAYAGKRRSDWIIRSTYWDHPRVCGEKFWALVRAVMALGSPPRVRGKGYDVVGRLGGVRITPACAGKSLMLPAQQSNCWDHPRVCGEKTEEQKERAEYLGSPPRMRGKAGRGGQNLARRGITPACAGKSSIQHLTASLGEFEVQKGHPVPHLRQRLQVWPDHARHLRHGLIPHASRSAGQGRRLCPGPCPDTAGSGTPRGPSPAKRPHRSLPTGSPAGCRAWQSGSTAPGSR